MVEVGASSGWEGVPGLRIDDAITAVAHARGWEVDHDVVADLLAAVEGDADAFALVVARATGPVDLLVRPFRPIDLPGAPAGSEELGDDVLQVALLHAVADSTHQAVRSLVGDLDADGSARAEAVDRGLLRRSAGAVLVADPVATAQLWWSASEQRRSQVLNALADQAPDPETRAWCRAWATTSPNATVARALADVGHDALAGGAALDGAMALETAAVLHDDARIRSSLILQSAQAFLVAGRPRHALALLRREVAATDDTVVQASMHRFIGRVLLFDGDLPAAEAHLVAHAGPIAEVDRAAGQLLRAEALWVRAIDNRMSDALELIGPAPADAATVEEDPVFVRACRTGMRNLLGLGVTRAEVEARVADLTAMSPEDPDFPLVGYVIIHACVLLGAHDIGEDVIALLARTEVRHGVATNPVLRLSGGAELAWWRGNWALAKDRACECTRAAQRAGDAIGDSRAVLTLARLCFASHDGEAEGQRILDERLSRVPAWSRPALLAARGHGHLVRGRADEAVAVLHAAVERETQADGTLLHPRMSAAGADYCTALILADHRSEARAWLSRWRHGPGADSRWVRGAARRCDALLADDDAADEASVEAVTLLEGMPLEQGRAFLEWGQRLLRRHQADAARPRLRRALAAFVGLGATAWQAAARTSIEEARSQRPGVAGLEVLTEQERQIAGLVASGMTNREVGEALFLSPKTVENRLTAIYATLGIRHRVDLARHLGTR